MATTDKERDFQAEADKYAHNSISCIKEMTDALDHAESDCDGEIECEHCEGTGTIITDADGAQVSTQRASRRDKGQRRSHNQRRGFCALACDAWLQRGRSLHRLTRERKERPCN
jgi:hypothetical protein